MLLAGAAADAALVRPGRRPREAAEEREAAGTHHGGRERRRVEQDRGAAGEERADAAGGGHGGDAHGVPQPRRPRRGGDAVGALDPGGLLDRPVLEGRDRARVDLGDGLRLRPDAEEPPLLGLVPRPHLRLPLRLRLQRLPAQVLVPLLHVAPGDLDLALQALSSVANSLGRVDLMGPFIELLKDLPLLIE